MLRHFSALLSVAALLVSPAAGFDTSWHSLCSQKVGEQFGFTKDAWEIMQLGNFSPDFFGPVSQLASDNPAVRGLDGLKQYQANNPQDRAAAIFLHFDNLNSDFKNNSDFDSLFSRLLENTRQLLAGYANLRADERVRKVLTLVTLGASLHAIQDFYSHSNWIHNDFDKAGVKMVALPSGGVRAPTWFELRATQKDPGKWSFPVETGIYPPVTGVLKTHTHMNHDNSRLMYMEYENPGQPPLRSEAEHHNAGPVPARGDDASNLAHQQLAVNTAIAASIEWVRMVEENPEARKAIESAKNWNLKTHDPRLAKELEAGILAERTLSCAAGKWDGDDPPGDRGLLCRSVLDGKMNSTGGAPGSRIESEILGLAANLLMPFALKFTGMFWDVHAQYHILEHLTESIGSGSGHYSWSRLSAGHAGIHAGVRGRVRR